MKMLRYKEINLLWPEETKYIFVAASVWCLLLSLARLQPFPKSLSAANSLESFSRCIGRIAFVSNALRSPVRRRVLAFGSRNSLPYSLLPSAVVTSIDPSVKASEGSSFSGLSHAIGRQPLRIKSDHLRLSLLNLGLIDSAALPVNMLSKLNNAEMKSISIIQLCQDDCLNHDDLGGSSFKPLITITPQVFENYILSFYPNYLPDYQNYCKK